MNLKVLTEKAKTKLTKLTFWLEILTIILLTAAWSSDLALFERMAFTVVAAALAFGVIFTIGGGLVVAVTGVKSGKPTHEPETPYGWCVDAVTWVLMVMLGWTWTPIIWLFLVFSVEAIARAQQSILAERKGEPQHGPLIFQLHADGLLIEPTEYKFTIAGLVLRTEELTNSNLALSAFRDGNLLFRTRVSGAYYPVMFTQGAPAVDADVHWDDEIVMPEDKETPNV